MKKLLIFSLLTCFVLQLSAMDSNKSEKEGKQSGSISQEEESISISIQDAGNPVSSYLAKIKTLRRRIRNLKKKNGKLTQQNQEQAEQIRKLKRGNKVKSNNYGRIVGYHPNGGLTLYF